MVAISVGVISCTGGGTDAPSSDGSSAAAGNGPTNWTLPLQAYMPDQGQQELIRDARESLVASCMKRHGFAYKPAQKLPQYGPKSLTDLRYGIHDATVAARYGYKPAVDLAAVAEQERRAMQSSVLPPEQEAVLTGQAGAKAAPPGGCLGEAHRKIVGTGEAESTLPQDLANQAYIKSKESAAVRKAFSGWSACMKSQGYQYAEPMDAVNDRRFASRKAGPLELATAKADIGCREQNSVIKAWYAAEAELQKGAVERNAERLRTVKSDLAQAVKNAARVLGKSG
ncbi:hypothetical protein GCM10014713_22270 [Streptomyces purpureus]|uniref:Uncharacterized protein n=2 Tax=Streptomyces purpureus TaxID=1951 RepID=A0A918LN06_9ACTN|nr:hypothetical protein GCM10014713_22270 [Streptomyces purpureus]